MAVVVAAHQRDAQVIFLITPLSKRLQNLWCAARGRRQKVARTQTHQELWRMLLNEMGHALQVLLRAAAGTG